MSERTCDPSKVNYRTLWADNDFCEKDVSLNESFLLLIRSIFLLHVFEISGMLFFTNDCIQFYMLSYLKN